MLVRQLKPNAYLFFSFRRFLDAKIGGANTVFFNHTRSFIQLKEVVDDHASQS
jgi:hypothetical protein